MGRGRFLGNVLTEWHFAEDRAASGWDEHTPARHLKDPVGNKTVADSYHGKIPAALRGSAWGYYKPRPRPRLTGAWVTFCDMLVTLNKLCMLAKSVLSQKVSVTVPSCSVILRIEDLLRYVLNNSHSGS